LKYAVVGGAGFVGSHLVDLLVEKYQKVVVVDNFFLGKMENLKDALTEGDVVVYREDARFLTSLENIFEIEKPHVVFNLAVQPLPYSFINSEGTYMTSVEVANNLAYMLNKNRYEKLIHFSSSEAYGNAEYTPMDEEHPLKPTTPYGAGKASAVLMLQSYYKLLEGEFDVSIICPFNIYGPRQNMGSYSAVIPITIRRLLTGEAPVIEGDGLQTRDFTYVKDVVNAAYDLSKCDSAIGKVVNVGQGKETSIKDIIFQLCESFKYPLSKIKYDPPRPADIERMLADTSLAKKLINYSPTTPLEKGLRLTVEWMKSTFCAFVNDVTEQSNQEEK